MMPGRYITLVVFSLREWILCVWCGIVQGGVFFFWAGDCDCDEELASTVCFGGFPAMDCLYDGVVYHVFSRTTQVIDTGKNWRIEHFEYRNDGYLFGEFKVLFYYGLFRQNFGTKNRRDECRFEDCLRWEGSS